VSAGASANSVRRPTVRRAVWWWAPVVVYAAGIFIASSISQPPSLPEIVSDKSVHGGLYAGFALVILRALARRWDRVTFLTGLGTIVLVVLYGVSDEFHQSFVPGRTSDIADVVADGVGAAVAVGIAWLFAKFGVRRVGIRI
jgi:VanZ family protein